MILKSDQFSALCLCQNSRLIEKKLISDDYHPGSPIVLFGILPHEQKMSVLNLVVKKCAEVTRPVKSKERLIFHIGFRRFSACPIFSQHTNGSKHKVFTVFLWLSDRVFSFQNNPKDLDPSCKTDLDLWDCLGRVKLVL